METLRKKGRTLSLQQMNSCLGGKIIRVFYYDQNGQLRYRDIIVK
jgi:hypothetical protein